MNFAFTEEQEELRKTVRQFLDAKSPEEAVREQMETEAGYDAAVWSQMGEQNAAAWSRVQPGQSGDFFRKPLEAQVDVERRAIFDEQITGTCEVLTRYCAAYRRRRAV